MTRIGVSRRLTHTAGFERSFGHDRRISSTAQMRILHLGPDIASQLSTTVRALRAIGLDAHGLVLNPREPVSRRDGLIGISTRGAVAKVTATARVFQEIAAADVLHWHWGPVLLRGLDVAWAGLLGKRGLVEFWGSDIRVSSIEAADNHLFAAYCARFPSEILTAGQSRRVQSQFARRGFECLISCRSLLPNIQTDLFSNVHFIRQRVLLTDFPSRPPDATQRRPRIVHSPSSRGIKGTELVLAALAELSQRHSFDFDPVENVSHSEALERMAKADIFIDQMILGAHGIATLEAMAFGKPVVSFIKPSMASLYPSELPLLNAAPDDLAAAVAPLLEDGMLRNQIGLRSRAYVERFHDAVQLAHDLAALYAEVTARVRSSAG